MPVNVETVVLVLVLLAEAEAADRRTAPFRTTRDAIEDSIFVGASLKIIN
jgi:hypothetical protein